MQSTQHQNQSTKLYCIAYEKLTNGQVIARTHYLHAEDENVARLHFVRSTPNHYRIGVHYRIVSVAIALGALFKQGEEDKDGAVGEIE